jgi:general secretion pathway protein J
MLRTAKGLTLLEMLVVLVVAALLGTLLVQGFGFFLGKYDAVRRMQSRAFEASVQQLWFVSTVQSMVPLLAPDQRFVGDPTGFEGTTLQPLAAQSGVPRRIGWKIRNDQGVVEVHYVEADQIDWRVMQFPAPSLSFQYADAAGTWFDAWPVSGTSTTRIPGMVRLIKDTGETVWAARLELYPEPIPYFLDMS